jgi:geranylgeranyl diphosphate synthase type I
VHDDIADGDEERRSQPSLWKQFGLAHAINIGDIFIPLGALAILESTYDAQIKLRLMRSVCEFSIEVSEGQSLDINLRETDIPSLEQYMACTRKKTGSFMAMATTGGGIIGGAHPKHLQALKQFSLLAGTAFQIKDDLLDLMGGKGRTVGSDILEGKRTLLAVYALERASERDRRRLLRILNKPRTAKSDWDLHWVCSLYRRLGAAEETELVAERLIEEAIEHLVKLPETAAKYRLIKISRYLSRRTQ